MNEKGIVISHIIFKEYKMRGIGVSTGIAIGKVFKVSDDTIDISYDIIDNVDEELERVNYYFSKIEKELKNLHIKTLDEIGPDEAQIFEAHLMILKDPEIINEIYGFIKEEKISGTLAIKKVILEYEKRFSVIKDEYIKGRLSDIKDVLKKVIMKLMNLQETDLSQLSEEVIIVGKDITPSDTVKMEKTKVLGFVTSNGGRNSHSAIMARSLQIPAIVGIGEKILSLENGDVIAINGESGEVILNPDTKTIYTFQQEKSMLAAKEYKLRELSTKESVTLDGYKIEIASNVSNIQDTDLALKNGSEGIGLLRTEFIYMSKNSFPSEDEQFFIYKRIIEKMNNKPVIIRTLDIGGDKELPYLNIGKEDNPFLGLRAIRLCLERPKIFITQLRAILRASHYGKVRIMFPMISQLQQLVSVKNMLKEIKTQLSNESIPYDEDIQVGMMIEVPSAAIISDIFAQYVDFFSIGTNDLIQYTVAVDRGNKNVESLYDIYHPAVFRLIKTVIDNAHKNNIRVGICGEMAGDVNLTKLLVGMGIDELSMSPGSILQAREIIRKVNKSKLSSLVSLVINALDSDEVKNILKNF